MHIHIDNKDGLPIYQQIVQQIKYFIACGRLQPHEELPGVRALAEQLLINPNTVARAYRDLETIGLIYKKHGLGVYVSETGTPLSNEVRRRILGMRIDGMLAEANQLRYGLDEILAFVREQACAMPAFTQEGK